jgi:phosphoenolpyruvate carboxykinase (ATP)
MVRHPSVYARLLAERIRRHGSTVWLVNTGWSAGPYGTGRRIRIPHTRGIIDAIHSGDLGSAPVITDPVFGIEIITRCPNVPNEILTPRSTWHDASAYDKKARQLAGLFTDNFAAFRSDATAEIEAAGPAVS